MFRSSGANASSDLDDRLQRALQEVQQLKVERNELQTKLRHVQTQFRRLTADLRHAAPPELTGGSPQPSSSTSPPPAGESAVGGEEREGAADATRSHADPILSSSRGAAVMKAKLKKKGLLSTSPGVGGKAATLPSLWGSVSPVKRGEKPRRLGSSPDRGRAELEATQLALRRCTAELEHQREIDAELRRRLLSFSPSSSPTTGPDTPPASKAKLSVEVTRLTGENGVLKEQMKLLRDEVQRLQEAQQHSWQSSQQHLASLSTQLHTSSATQQHQELEYQKAIRELTFERDQLRLTNQSLEESVRRERERSADTEARLAQHQRQSVEQLQMLATTSHGGNAMLQEEHHGEAVALRLRVQQLESEAETGRKERERLTQELRVLFDRLAEAKQAALQTAQEKLALQHSNERVGQLERDLEHKTQELVALEQQLQQSIGSLQACNRETEEAVRREVNIQIAELQQQIESAVAQRREMERESLECRQQAAEAKRAMTRLQEDVDMYKAHIAKLEKEYASSSDLAAAAAQGEVAGPPNVFAQYAKRGGMTEEEMHRALAVAALRKRSVFSERDAGLVSDGGVSSLTPEAKQTLDLFESLGWDEKWEAKQMREALATAALDLELSEQQAQQERVQAEKDRKALQQVAAERDALLEENIEMRRRLSHVQTVFAKQQLQAYRTALELEKGGGGGGAASSQMGQVNLCLRAVELEDTILSALHITDRSSPVSLFFSLDGLQAYDTMLSPTFYSLPHGPIDVLFQFDGLAPDELTAAEIQRTTFVLQLHRSTQDGSEVVAQGEFAGTVLLHAREMSLEECVTLFDGCGRRSGHVLVEYSCMRLMLPITLGLPLSTGGDGLVLSAVEMKAALVALRSVIALRVQVFRLEGCGDGVVAAAGPAEGKEGDGEGEAGTRTSRQPACEPYVFYTTSSPIPTVSPIRDTVVQATGRRDARSLLLPPHAAGSQQDIVFEQDPTDHRVAVDRDFIHFMCYSSIVFVLFDAKSTEMEENLGSVEIPLKPLLESPQALIHKTQALHPRGRLTIGISWVTSA